MRQGKGLVNALQTLALCAAAIGFGFVGLKAKPYWLGTKVYFIPSRSMSPTLMVGDFVLTDTWRYNRHSAEPGDIVVFEQPVENRTMIKRVRDVSPAPDLADYLYHVVGDDLKVSLDSRHYGKIRQESLKAEARLVLFSLDPMSKVRRERFLLTL